MNLVNNVMHAPDLLLHIASYPALMFGCNSRNVLISITSAEAVADMI